MRVLLSDHDPYVASWLRNLYPAAEILERDIAKLKGQDLEGRDRVHLFAGIGGWEYALELAGWTGPVWTGSCPCQPFSSAGKRKAEADERHLWPEFRRLIDECRPPTIFGEQVESKDGRRWLAGVRADLEAMGYRFGAADLCAAGAGAPHIRQRLYWVADTKDHGQSRRQTARTGRTGTTHDGSDGRMADTGRASDERRGGPGEATGAAGSDEGEAQQRERGRVDAGRSSSTRGLGDTSSQRRNGIEVQLLERGSPEARIETSGTGGVVGVEHPDNQRREGRHERRDGAGERAARQAGVGFWDAYDTLPMLDGKARRVRPGSFPLATGVPARVAKLRAIGNSIVPQVAAQFVKAYMAVEKGV